MRQDKQASIHELIFFGPESKQILCRLADTHELMDYQTEIMNGRGDRFLAAEVMEEGRQAYLIYDKSGYISLEQYFLSRQADRKELFTCLHETLLTLNLCRDILLDARQIVLDERFVYLKQVDPSSKQVTGFDPYFLYIPAEAKVMEPVTDAEAMLLSDLLEFCIEQAQQKSLFLEEEILLMRQYVTGDIDRFVTWLEEKLRHPEKPRRRKIADAKHKSPRKTSKPKSEPKQAVSPFKTLVLVDIALLFLLNISLTMAIRTQSALYYSLTAIGLFILIASDVYLLRLAKTEDVSDTRFEQERRQAKLRELEAEEGLRSLDETFAKAKSDTPPKEQFSIAYLYPLNREDDQATEPDRIMEKSKPAAVILNREFYIGSDMDRCDFKPQSGDLSPLHARITKQDGTYLLTDLASESGTYLNNLRLHYYEDYVLFTGAFIRFHDQTYLFAIEDELDLGQSA